MFIDEILLAFDDDGADGDVGGGVDGVICNDVDPTAGDECVVGGELVRDIDSRGDEGVSVNGGIEAVEWGYEE